MELLEYTPHFLSLLFGVAVGVVGCILSSYYRSKKDGAYEKEKEIFYQTRNDEQYILKNIHEEKLEKEYLKGIERGKEDERKKLEVVLTPYLEIDNGFFNNTLHRGYFEKVTYNGLSIGGSKYHPIETIEKFNQENFDKVLTLTTKTLENIANNFTSKLINTIVEPGIVDRK